MRADEIGIVMTIACLGALGIVGWLVVEVLKRALNGFDDWRTRYHKRNLDRAICHVLGRAIQRIGHGHDAIESINSLRREYE